MGVITPNLPPFALDEWRTKPFRERMRISAQHLADNGFGTPSAIAGLYVIRMAIYLVGAALIISASTPGLGTLGDIGTWWLNPIVLQKVVIFTIIWEAIGFGGGGGPLTFRFLPPLGSITYWLRPGTVRLPPFRNLPGTRGDKRSWLDVLLYAGFLGALVWALIAPPAASATAPAGLVDPTILIVALALWLVMGLRDQITFLAARADQYIYWVIAFVVMTQPDMLLAGKIFLLLTWWGAGLSKLNKHFPYVVTVMMANSPMLPKALKRKLFRNHPEDLRPSKLVTVFAHFGTVVEFGAPLVLIFSQNFWVTLVALLLITGFHLFIATNMPAAVPLAWNLFMIIAGWFLFLGYPNATANPFTDFQNPTWVIIMVVFIVGMIVWGSLQPRFGSFLFGMRYYAGNWASSTWLLRPGVEQTIDKLVTKTAPHTVKQLQFLYPEDVAEWFTQKAVAWRSMHGQGRVHMGLTDHAVDNPDDYIVREGEFFAGHVIGWNFGDGHLHDEQLLDALQRRCNFAPGDVRVIMLEGQAIHSKQQAYRIYDPAIGVIERGTVEVNDMVNLQPWLPGQVGYPATVLYRHDGTPSAASNAAGR